MAGKKLNCYGCSDDWVLNLQKAVKMLHFGRWEEQEAAAQVIKQLAEEGVKPRKIVAELGVIPPLVAMVGSEPAARRILAVQALIEVTNGSFTNNVLMVEAGVLSRLPDDISPLDEIPKQEFARLLLSISSLASTQFPLSLTRMMPTLVSILESTSNLETQKTCLTTLHNLSSLLHSTASLASPGVVDALLTLSSVKETSEKALATLANLVVTASGRNAIEHNLTVPDRFIEIMAWEDWPKCQEQSAYILMMLAHQSSLPRQKMAEAGIVPVLLELALLGSPLARKRALKMLQWFRDGRQAGVENRSLSFGATDVDDGKVSMKKIVKQSLYKNMETITRRAKGAEGSSLKLKALMISSSSKSLPY